MPRENLKQSQMQQKLGICLGAECYCKHFGSEQGFETSVISLSLRDDNDKLDKVLDKHRAN